MYKFLNKSLLIRLQFDGCITCSSHISVLVTGFFFLFFQILKTGFFHADPHPGNLAIDMDGALIYYDFGMMGEIKSFTRERLLELFYAIYEKDAKKVCFQFINIII